MAKTVDIGWRKYEPKFGGGEVTMSVKPLTVEALLELAPLFTMEEGEKGMQVLVTYLGIQKAAKGMIEPFISEMQGLVKPDGQPVTIGEVFEVATLSGLAVEIVAHLIRISRLQEDEEKN